MEWKQLSFVRKMYPCLFSGFSQIQKGEILGYLLNLIRCLLSTPCQFSLLLSRSFPKSLFTKTTLIPTLVHQYQVQQDLLYHLSHTVGLTIQNYSNSFYFHKIYMYVPKAVYVTVTITFLLKECQETSPFLISVFGILVNLSNYPQQLVRGKYLLP